MSMRKKFLSTAFAMTTFLASACSLENDDSQVKSSDAVESKNVVLIGDSISRGLFLDTEFDTENTHTIVQKIMNQFQSELIQIIFGSPSMLDVVVRDLFDKLDADESFTNLEESGPYKYSKEIAGLGGKVYTDGASSGRSLSDTEKLIKANTDATDASKVDTVVYQLGTLEFCGYNGTESIEERYEASLEKVMNAFPYAEIQIITPINIPAIVKLTDDKEIDPKTQDLLLGSIQTYRQVAANLYGCTNLTQYTNDRLRTHFKDFKADIINAIESLQNNLGRKICVADFSDNLEFIEAKHLAFDGFHPNASASKDISEQIAKRMTCPESL